MGLEKSIKVCRFGLKVEIRWWKARWSLKWRGDSRGSLPSLERPAGHSSKHFMCVLRQSLYYTQRVPATEERYVRNLSDCILISHTSSSKNKIYVYIIKLYVYISPSPSVFVQRFDYAAQVQSQEELHSISVSCFCYSFCNITSAYGRF